MENEKFNFVARSSMEKNSSFIKRRHGAQWRTIYSKNYSRRRTKRQPPPPPPAWFEFLVILDFFAPWYISRCIFCENCKKKTLKGKWVKCAPEFARLHKVSIQSCTQNRPSPKVQSRWRDFLSLGLSSGNRKLGTLVHHVPGCKLCLRFFKYSYGFSSRKNGVKSRPNFERPKLSPGAKIKILSQSFINLPFFHSAKTVSVYRNSLKN